MQRSYIFMNVNWLYDLIIQLFIYLLELINLRINETEWSFYTACTVGQRKRYALYTGSRKSNSRISFQWKWIIYWVVIWSPQTFFCRHVAFSSINHLLRDSCLDSNLSKEIYNGIPVQCIQFRRWALARLLRPSTAAVLSAMCRSYNVSP